MDFEALDWPRLERLRALFLGEQFEPGPYWREAEDLAVYEVTLGERIGWKWDAVLRELKARGWQPPAGCALWDWGCGSGVAGRRVLAAWPGAFSGICVTDHSPVATQYALRRFQEQWPELHGCSESPAGETPYVLCVSHVWNELTPADREELKRTAAQAQAVLWVEPGVHSVARDLQAVRGFLMEAGGQRVVAPCTHQQACGLLSAGNERHWCHHFADPPPEIFANSDWVRFGHRAGIDLRALPYAFLVTESATAVPVGPTPAGLQRLLGKPRVYKGFARPLFCGAAGVRELEVFRRTAPAIYKAWLKERGGDLYEVSADPKKPHRAAVITEWKPG